MLYPDDWRRAFGGLRQEYNMNVSGGNEQFRFYGSGSYLSSRRCPPTVPTTKRYNGMMKIDYQARKWIKIGGTARFIHNNTNNNNYAYYAALNAVRSIPHILYLVEFRLRQWILGHVVLFLLPDKGVAFCSGAPSQQAMAGRGTAVCAKIPDFSAWGQRKNSYLCIMSKKVSINIVSANVFAFLLFVGCIVVLGVPFTLIWPMHEISSHFTLSSANFFPSLPLW